MKVVLIEYTFESPSPSLSFYSPYPSPSLHFIFSLFFFVLWIFYFIFPRFLFSALKNTSVIENHLKDYPRITMRESKKKKKAYLKPNELRMVKQGDVDHFTLVSSFHASEVLWLQWLAKNFSSAVILRVIHFEWKFRAKNANSNFDLIIYRVDDSFHC